MSMLIGLTAATLTGNHGAEAMVSTVTGRLRETYPDARFVLFSYYPTADRGIAVAPHLQIASATPKRLVIAHLPGALLGACLPKSVRKSFGLVPADMRLLSQCDMLVDMAGVAFIDGREKFLPFNILTVLPAMLLGVPVVKASQAMGPFKHAINRFAAKWILPHMAAIHARGAQTKAYLDELGLSNVTPAADVAFLLDSGDRLVKPDPLLPQSLGAIAKLRADGRKVVGVCPSSVVYSKSGESYLDALAQLIRAIEAQGVGVVFVPNATRAADGESLRNNDLPVIRKLVDKLEAKADRVVIDRDIDAVSIKEVIGAVDVMVISRFHAMIGALALAKPTLVFGWSHKYAEVMADFGLEHWVFDYAKIDIASIVPGFLDLVAKSDAASAEIAAKVPEVKARSRRQIDTMLGILGKRKKP